MPRSGPPSKSTFLNVWPSPRTTRPWSELVVPTIQTSCDSETQTSQRLLLFGTVRDAQRSPSQWRISPACTFGSMPTTHTSSSPPTQVPNNGSTSVTLLFVKLSPSQCTIVPCSPTNHTSSGPVPWTP